MTPLPKVSVITGFYNRGHLLSRTLDSLLAQTYPELEIIVFDDCSRDDTRARLAAYAARNDPRLTIILHERNKGFTQGMIDAIAGAKGEIIAVHGSGDEATPDRIEKQAQRLIERPDVGVVGSYYENIIEDAGIVRLRTPNADNVTLESLARGNVFTHGEVMYRKSVYEASGGYRTEFKYCQDYDLWLRMIRLCRFSTVPEMLYKRYVQFEGVSYAPEKAIVQARYFLLCQRMAKMPESEQNALLERLRTEGPLAIVPATDKALQKRIVRNCLRQIVWGNSDQAAKLAGSIDNPALRFGVISFSKLFSARIFSQPRRLVFRYLGIEGGAAK